MELESTILQPEYRREVIGRFKLDAVEDAAFENASDDRIREEFRAWMKGLGYAVREDEKGITALARALSTLPISGENICLALDEARITELANLTMSEPRDGLRHFQGVTVRAIEGTWWRPAEVESDQTYRGVGDVSITGLAMLYYLIASPVNGYSMHGMMHDLHPLNGMPRCYYWRHLL